MEEALNTPILSGQPLPKHEHRRMMIGFIAIAVILIIAILAIYYFASRPSSNISTAPVAQRQP